MLLSKHGREYYALTITTEPATAATDWEASFDAGATWVNAVDEGGRSAWLVAGPSANPTGATVLTNSLTPLIRLTDNPEIVVRSAPQIRLTK